MVPKKSANSRVTPEESMEGRAAANGKSAPRNARRAQDRGPRAHAPERIGAHAKQTEGGRFNNLLSHLKVPLLKEAYQRLRKDAAPGVDGQTWEEYGEKLDANLLDLQDRIHRGSYHPQPVRRVYIPKPDGGGERPLGIPALEDKIVQGAVRALLEPIYEASEFLGFSYGFRRGRSQHDALDALHAALKRNVRWVLDADIRKFFETIEHDWMKRFLEHRIADQRMVRLLMKWLHAGVMEDGEVREVEEGTPQGGLISPLLANIYLHYALDLWVHQWRQRHAHGEVYIVRYADDFVMAFEHEQDARAMRTALAERLARFGLALHEDKTRVIRFGRFAPCDCAKEGRRRPETFDFLGFTHIAAREPGKCFKILRRTSRKKRRAKLAAIAREARKRRHEPVRKQYEWLRSVLRGHYNYYGVPGNYGAMESFLKRARGTWHQQLQRRSQRARWNKEQRKRHNAKYPLPYPRITHRLPVDRYPRAPWTGGGSPVREIRTPGSVRGAG
jgi:RNA-directed DNA polymerase